MDARGQGFNCVRPRTQGFRQASVGEVTAALKRFKEKYPKELLPFEDLDLVVNK